MNKLNEGYCAELYEVDSDKILKLYRHGICKQEVLQEYKNTILANALGIPSPTVYDLVEQEGRYGFVLERLKDVTLLHQIQVKPWKAMEYARLMARLHFQIHNQPTHQIDLQLQKEMYKDAIKSKEVLTVGEKEELLRYLDFLSEGDDFCVCHGDFHPMNILFQGDNPVIIDWAFTSYGSPCADVAGTYMITKLMAVDAASNNKFENILYKIFTPIFAKIYLKEYLKLSMRTKEEILRWIPIRAAAYVELGLPEKENDVLYNIAKEFAEKTERRANNRIS